VSSEPALIEELALKRSITFKDPEKAKQPNMQLWNLINQYPSKVNIKSYQTKDS